MPLAYGSIVVVPRPTNLTGEELVVSGATLLEDYVFGAERITVPDVLQAEARRLLERAGFSTGGALASGRGPAAELILTLRRWEPDASVHASRIVVALGAELVEVKTHRVLWSGDHPARPEASPGVVVIGDAHVLVARRVMASLLVSLVPRPEPEPPTTNGPGPQ
ncbi:MAG TPA: hypothetical protein VFD71_03445 [Planctomycetota bacterium]|nr:hypothetical protein [Planctomycetota bacterium]